MLNFFKNLSNKYQSDLICTSTCAFSFSKVKTSLIENWAILFSMLLLIHIEVISLF